MGIESSTAEFRQFMRYFDCEHLPEGPLRNSSWECRELARHMVHELPDCPELMAGLRKLLEAKDCFVRAALDVGPSWVSTKD